MEELDEAMMEEAMRQSMETNLAPIPNLPNLAMMGGAVMDEAMMESNLAEDVAAGIQSSHQPAGSMASPSSE
jgi:hypothetical protein